ncbi:hypothetical protein Acr_09g0003750 [Actinidia rufa]|uniref:Uncharacterized protein n=1 Tax=Actinidia rufa TaxID=165716 RepID=A0A7J0F6V0_9ERIC|nr:hypothetical protein Acr_09g0003750 [Actinidia rufa]
METEEGRAEWRQTFRSGRTRTVAWRQSQLRAILKLIDHYEDVIFKALHQDLGKLPVEVCRDEVSTPTLANGQREPPCSPPNLGWYNQSNLGMGHESTYSQYYFEPHSYQEPFDYYHAPPPPYHAPPCDYPQTQFSPSDVYHIPHNSTQEDIIEDILEDTLKYQEEVNSRVDESINEIQSQLTLLMQILVVKVKHKSLVPSSIIQGCLNEPVHPITNHRNEDIIDKTILPQDLESKEDIPKVSEEIIENESRDEESKREESEIGDSKREKKGSTEITLNDDFGLLDVWDVHVEDDVNGLEAIPTMSRDHKISTFELLAPSPSLPEPLELHVSTLEPNIILMVDQLEEGEVNHCMARASLVSVLD